MNKPMLFAVFLLSVALLVTSGGCSDGITGNQTASELSLDDSKQVQNGKRSQVIVDPGAPALSILGQMVFVPGGTFSMGRTRESGLVQYADELPVHQVTLGSFYIGRCEVRQSQWAAVMSSNPSIFSGNGSRPVEMVSWYAVLVYCNKRSLMEGLTPAYCINGSTDPRDWGVIPTNTDSIWNAVVCNWSAAGYRLPTEAEWEYAARGGITNPDFIFAGNDSVGIVAWYNDNSENTTHPVGQKQANGLGIFDLSGNVQEWCWDWYNPAYYSSSPLINPTGPATGTAHSIRGGSWQQTASASRIAFRNYGTPGREDTRVVNSRLGFRVVRTYQPTNQPDR